MEEERWNEGWSAFLGVSMPSSAAGTSTRWGMQPWQALAECSCSCKGAAPLQHHPFYLSGFLIPCPPFSPLSFPGKLPNIFVSDWLWNQSNNTVYIKEILDILTFVGTWTRCPYSHLDVLNWENFQEGKRRMTPQPWTQNSPAVRKIKAIVVITAVVTCFLS